MDCIFCKIVKGEIPANKVYEDELVYAFKDIKPIAPVHILIIPKEHIPTIVDLSDGDKSLVGHMVLVARRLGDENELSDGGYKLLFRVKKHGGQEVDHIHLHLIGGGQLFEDIHPI